MPRAEPFRAEIDRAPVDDLRAGAAPDLVGGLQDRDVDAIGVQAMGSAEPSQPRADYHNVALMCHVCMIRTYRTFDQ